MGRPADRRAKIELLRAAESVFVERGLGEAKVEDITARAGVSKGAFYLHFESKEDCFKQIVEGFVAKLAECLEVRPDPARLVGLTDFAELIAFWHAHDCEMLEFCWQNRGLMEVLFSGGGGAAYRYLVDEFADRTAQQIEAWARHLISAGVYRPDLDPEVLPALMSGAYERLVRELIKRPKRPDVEGWARQAMMLLMSGLLTEEARAVLDRQVSVTHRAASEGPTTAERGTNEQHGSPSGK
jgi:AcrR family transcriptional regulator